MTEESTVFPAEPHSDGIRERYAPMPFYFKVLFGGLLVWAVVFTGYFLLSGWSSSDYFERKMSTHQEALQ